MKTLIYLLSVVSCLAQLSLTDPEFLVLLNGRNGGVGSCITARDSFYTSFLTADYSFTIGDLADNKNCATSFEASASYTVCRVVIPLQRVGVPPFNLSCSIYDDNSGSPGSQVGSTSASVDASTISDTEELVEFSTMDSVLTSGTTYWIVLTADTPSTTPGISVLWYMDAKAGQNTKINDDVLTSWEAYASNQQAAFTIYSD